jgi:hypothetical protein
MEDLVAPGLRRSRDGASADAPGRLYGVYATIGRGDELLARDADLPQGLAELPFLAGFCYTQPYDVA